jgi:hypothetical protein
VRAMNWRRRPYRVGASNHPVTVREMPLWRSTPTTSARPGIICAMNRYVVQGVLLPSLGVGSR